MSAGTYRVGGIDLIFVTDTGGTAGGGVAIAAGVQLATSGTVIMSDSNGVSFGLNNQTLTASVDGIKSISAGTTRVTNNEAVFSNANNVSFGAAGQTITASASFPADVLFGIAAGGQTVTTGTVIMSNSNGVSFGLNNSTLTASVDAGATATGNFGALAAGTQTATSGTVVLSGSNGISFGMSGSSRITATFDAIKSLSAGTTRLTNGEAVFSNSNGIGFGVAGNTVTASFDGVRSVSAGTESSSYSGLTFADANNVSFGINAGVITATVTTPAETPFGISAGTQSASTGTVILADSNGVSFGLSGSSQITASVDGIKSVSAGTTRVTNNEVIFADANGVSFGANGQTVTASIDSGATATGNLGALAAGTQTATSGTVVIADSNGLSFGMSGSSQITATADYVRSISAGGADATGNRVIFSNSNNVTFGANGATITASASYSTPVVSNAIQDVGTATGSGTNTSRFAADDHVHRGVAGVDVNGIASTFYGTVQASAGNLISIATAGASTRGSLQFINLLSSSAIAQPVSSVSDAGTLSSRFALADHAHAGVNSVSAVGNTSGDITGGAGSLVLAGGANITLSGATAAGGMTLSISGPTQTSPVVGNAIQDVGTATGSGTNVTRFAADDHVHRGVVGVDVNGIGSTFYGTVQASAGNLMSIATGGASTRGSLQFINLLSSSAIAQPVSSASAAGTLASRFALADHAHAGINSVSAVGNTSGDITGGAGSLVLAGGANITLSGATAAGGMTLSISGPTQTSPVVSNAIQDVGTATASGTNVTRFAADDHVHRGVIGVDVNGIASTFYGTVQASAGNLISIATGGASTRGSIQFINLLSSSAIAQPVSSASAAGTLASRFALADHAHAGINSVSVAGNTAGTISAGAGSIVFAGGPNVTLSGSTAAGGMTLSISGPTQTSPVVSNAIQDVGTATGSGTNVTRFAADDHVHRGVIGVDVNGIASTFYGTVQASAGNLISIATGGGSTRGSLQFINLLSSSAIAQPVSSASAAGTLASRFALADHAHAGINSVSVVGNTAGTISAGAGSIVFAGGPNITLSGSTAAGGMTLSISSPNETSPVVSNAIQDVGTATGSGTNTSRFAADDHVHRGVVGVDVNGIASTFYGTVQMSAGNLMSIATGGGSTRGSIQFINLLSSSAIAQPVSSASSAGSLASRFALADHAHAGLNSISVAGNTGGTTSAGAGSLVLAGDTNITLNGATAAGGMTISISGAAGAGGGVAIAAGTQTATSGTVVFSNSNGLTMGMSGSTRVTGSFQAIRQLSMDDGTANGSNIRLNQDNGITVSHNGNTIYFQPYTQVIQENVRGYGMVANAAATNSGDLNLSLQRFTLIYPIFATRLDFIGHLTVAGSTAGSTTVRVGFYSRANGNIGSTLNSIATTSATISFNSGGATNNTNSYIGQSGTRWRSMSLPTVFFNAGYEYWIGLINSVNGPAGTTGSMSIYGKSGVSLNALPGGGNQAEGVEGLYSAATGALPTSIQLTEINYTGASVGQQPYFVLYGTY